MHALTNYKFIKRKKVTYNYRRLIMTMILTTCKSICIIKLRITDLLLLYIKNVNTGSLITGMLIYFYLFFFFQQR